MKSFKNLLPIIIMTAVAFYGYQKFFQIPEAILTGIVFLPIMLALLVIGLTFHFSRSQIFFYVILVIISNMMLGLHWVQTDMRYALLSGLLPVLLLGFTILPERGIISLRALPAYVMLLFAFIFSMYILIVSPQWATYLILSDWLPERYFDWTTQSQTVIYISIVVFIYMLILYFLRPSSNAAAGMGVLVMLVSQLHYGGDSDSLNVYSIMALIMCLYAVIHESWRMAYMDELTELPTRRALREKFQKIGGNYTVAMLDVDHFKKFNDTYGHDTGDAVLRMIATKMAKVTGGGASYRYGGEEFTVVFNGKNAEDAMEHLDALREKIASTPFVVNRASRRKSDREAKPKKNASVTVTVSIGVADSKGKFSSTKSATKTSVMKSARPSPWDVLKLADKALYRAKKKGRNCVCS